MNRIPHGVVVSMASLSARASSSRQAARCSRATAGHRAHDAGVEGSSPSLPPIKSIIYVRQQRLSMRGVSARAANCFSERPKSRNRCATRPNAPLVTGRRWLAAPIATPARVATFNMVLCPKAARARFHAPLNSRTLPRNL